MDKKNIAVMAAFVIVLGAVVFSYNQQLDAMNSRILGLEQENARLATDISSLQSIKSDVVKLSQTNDEIQKVHVALSSQLTTISSRVDEVKSQQTVLTTDISNLQGKTQMVEKDVSALTTSAIDLRMKIGSVQAYSTLKKTLANPSSYIAKQIVSKWSDNLQSFDANTRTVITQVGSTALEQVVGSKVKGLAWTDDSVTSRGGNTYYTTAKTYIKIDTNDIPVAGGILNAAGLNFLKLNIEITAGGLVDISTGSISNISIVNVAPAVSL